MKRLAVLAVSLLAFVAPAVAATLEESLLDALAAQGAPGDGAVSIVGRAPTALDPDALDIVKLSYDANTTRFVVQLRLTTARIISLQGKVEAGVDVPVLNRAVRSGELIASEDVEFVRMAQSRVHKGTLTDAERIIGFSSKRQLRAGTALRVGDLENPIVVRKGDAVTMVFRMPGVELTARGKAMTNGGLGDTIAIVNVQSHKQVEAVVTGAGAVTVSPQGVAIN